MTASASSAADALVFDPSVQWPPGSPARYPCREHFAPVRRSIGGCLPCPGYVLTTADGKPVPELANMTEKERGWKIDLRSAALAGDCINCLLQSGQPFFVGRPGMGAPEEVACRAMTGRTHNADNMSVFLNDQRRVLKQLNGILTRSDEDALSYARCYAASVNASDIVVRVGGGPYMPLRKPNHTCARPGSKHHQKSDILISQSGHFPSRVLGDRGLNPWVIAAYHMTRELQTGEEERRLLPRIFAWTRALQGRTVLVVHPFNESIVRQLRRGSRALWGFYSDLIMPPGIRFKVVTPPQNLAKALENADWREALDALIERVNAAGPFDLAMLSCGGLGMLLGSYLLETNRSAMYHGGELQLWFGVYGRRWAGDLDAKGWLNRSLLANWVRPLANETPAGASGVEKGTYW